MHDSKPLAPDTFWIAYSGGLDSHVLLHLYANAHRNMAEPCKAVHIHHNLSPNADQWEAHCKKICEELNVEYLCIHVNAHPKPGESPEAAARTARYEAFANLLKNSNDFLCTAHHQEDQAETLLLQLFRGAGVKGLAAMPGTMPLGAGYLIRPLLSWQKQNFIDYAKKHQLQWIEDESNLNTDFDRNYIRHQILPMIRQRWPAITPVLNRVANHCAEANELLDKLAERDLNIVFEKNEHLREDEAKQLAAFEKQQPLEHEAQQIQQTKKCLSIKKIISLSIPEQNNLLRYWLRNLGFPVPSTKQLQQFRHDILYSKPDANPLLHWEGVNIRRYRDMLYALPDKPRWEMPGNPLVWDMKHPITLPDGRVISSKSCPNIPIQTVEIRFRQHGKKSLKKIFQEYGIPPWERDSVPLLYVENKLIGIVNFPNK